MKERIDETYKILNPDNGYFGVFSISSGTQETASDKKAVILCPDGEESEILHSLKRYLFYNDYLISEIIYMDKSHFPMNGDVEFMLCRLLSYCRDSHFVIFSWFGMGEGQKIERHSIHERNINKLVTDVVNWLMIMSYSASSQEDAKNCCLLIKTLFYSAGNDQSKYLLVEPSVKILWERMFKVAIPGHGQPPKPPLFPTASESCRTGEEGNDRAVCILVIDDEWGDYHYGFIPYRNILLFSLSKLKPETCWIIWGTHNPDDMFLLHRNYPADLILVDISFNTIGVMLKYSPTWFIADAGHLGPEIIMMINRRCQENVSPWRKAIIGIVSGIAVETEKIDEKVKMTLVNEKSYIKVDAFCSKPEQKNNTEEIDKFISLIAEHEFRSLETIQNNENRKMKIRRQILAQRHYGKRINIGEKEYDLQYYPNDEWELLCKNTDIIIKMSRSENSIEKHNNIETIPEAQNTDPSENYLKSNFNKIRAGTNTLFIKEEKGENYTYRLKIGNGDIEEFPNRFWAAANPATGSSVERGEMADAFYNKILMLLKAGFGGVIAKTVYFPYERKEQKGKSKTRAYLSGDDLYNMGHTPKESITLKELTLLIDRLKNDDENERLLKKSDLKRIILSFGVKSHQMHYWDRIFAEIHSVDGEDDDIDFPIWEINARHSLREMSGFLPGQELFDEYAISPNPEASWASIFNWLDNLNRLGCEYKRKLIIKLPFRSDLLKICAHIDKLYKDNLNFTQEPPIEEIVKVKNIVNKDTENNPKISMNTHSVHGIVGVTLINTIKSPFTRLGEKGLWLKGENGDKMKVQQLSGRSLGGLRDWAIFAIKSTYGGLFISASGGIMDENDALGAVKLGADTVQIGTAFLIGGFPAAMRITDGFYNSHYKKMSLMQKEPEDYKRYYINVMTGIEKKNFPPREVEFNKHLCTRCGRCMQSHYCDAFINKYQSISIYPNVSNVDCCKRYNTTQCKAIKTCRQGALKHKNKKIELDRTKCKLCYECVADCEGNALKYKTMIEPVIEKTNCTGCGLCVQICESGALQIRYTKEL